MQKNIQYHVSEEQAGERLDAVVSLAFSLSRSQAQKLIKRGCVYVNDVKKDKASFAAASDDIISVREVEELPEQEVQEAMPGMPDIPIIDETDDYLIINKPSGVLVHPTQAEEEGTIADWLRERYPSTAAVGESPDRPGIVHRLDKDASGILVIAKTQEMYEHLKAQFQNRTMEKEYAVLVHGILLTEHGIIDFDIDRGKDGAMVARPRVDALSIKSLRTRQPGKEAITEYWVEKQYARFALLNVKIHTGRTHQIRVHFLAYNHPVVGDTLYFNKKLNRKRDLELGRIFLHAKRLAFVDLHGNPCEYTIPLPSELAAFLASIR